MTLPDALKAGDRVAMVSTARKISHQELHAAMETLQSWGLQVETGKSIGAEHFQFAGDDELRRSDFQQMLDDESIKAILFARGGYGTVRIIDQIDWRRFLKHPKWLCGFSDITVIHSHLLSVYHVAAIHSIMGISFPMATPESVQSLQDALFGKKLHYPLPPHPLNRPGDASGMLCGGNVSLLHSLLGSVSDIDTSGCILFVEEVDEHLYHLDRMMMALKRAGKFDNLSGLVAGHFTDMKNKDESNPFGPSAYEIIAGHIGEYDFPVCYGFPAGHEADNRTMIFGAEWNLAVNKEVVFAQT
jgi:muramoyltetrapeptide carboxypeptidase